MGECFPELRRCSGALARVSHSAFCRWLTKEGSFIKNLKERFATLHIGSNSTVVFDYREDPESVKVLGQYTLGPTAKCAPGDSCFPYPAHLVTHFFLGNGDDRIILCFDNERELASFKDAVAFGLNAKNVVKAVLEKKAEAKKNEELARMQLEIEEMEKTATLEKQIAQMQQLAAENEAVNARFESDRQSLSDEVMQLRLSVSVEKEKLAEEEQNRRTSVSQELLETKRSAEETAARAKMLLESNRRASLSLAEMEASVQNRFVAFRKRENSTSVLRTVDETEYNRRIEQEKVEQMAREQEEVDRQAKILSAQRLKDLEMAVTGRAQAEKSSVLELHREAAERADIENARRAQDRRDAEMLVAQRAEFARLDVQAQAQEQEFDKSRSVPASHSTEKVDGVSVKELLSSLNASGSNQVVRPEGSITMRSPLTTSPAAAPIKDRIKSLSVSGTFVAPLKEDEHVDSEGALPIKERSTKLHEVLHQKPAPTPVEKVDGVHVKHLLSSLSASGSNQVAQQNSKETLSLAQILEQEGSLVSESPQSGRQSPLSTSPAIAPIKDRIKRLSVSTTATSAAPLKKDEHVDSEGAVPIKDQVKRLNAVAAAVASFTSQPISTGGTHLDSEVVVPVRERAKRSSIVAAAVASMSEPATHSPSSASERPIARRPSVEDAFAIPIKERARSISTSVSPQVPQQKPKGAPSLSQLLEQEQGYTGAPAQTPHMNWIVRPSDA